MKIRNLDLHQFKCFKNQKIILDHSKNFHILLGKNETGKSTFFNAIFSLLFGFDKSSTLKKASDENFYLEGLFENNHGKFLKIERQLVTGRKGNSKIQAFYPQLNKEVFIETFFLNQQKLQIGSKELLVYLKNFDHALFHSVLGCQKLINLRQEMAVEAENLFKKNGVKPELNQNIEKIKTLVTEKKSKSLSDSEWSSLQISKQEIAGNLEDAKRGFLALEKQREELSILFEIQDYLVNLSELALQIEKNLQVQSVDLEVLAFIKKIDTEKNSLLQQNTQLGLELDQANQDLAKLSPIDELIISQKFLISELLAKSSQYQLELSKLKSLEFEFQEKEKEKAKWSQNTIVRAFAVSKSNDKLDVKTKLQNVLVSFKMLSQEYLQIKQNLDEVNDKLLVKPIPAGELCDSEGMLILQSFLIELKQNIANEERLNEHKNEFQTKLKELQTHIKIDERVITSVNREEFDNHYKKICELTKQINDYRQQLEEFVLCQSKIKVKLGKEHHFLLSTMKHYQEIKAERKQLGLDLQTKWLSYSANELHQLFMKYHHMIGDEDLREADIFQKLDQIVEVKKNEELYQELEIKIAEVKSQEKIFTDQYNEHFKEVAYLLQISDKNQVIELNIDVLNETLLIYEKMEQIQTPLSQLEKKICSLLGYKDSAILIPDLINLVQNQIVEQDSNLKLQREAHSKRAFFEQSKINLEQKLEQLNHDIIQCQLKLDQLLIDFDLKLPLVELETSLNALESYFSLTQSIALLVSQNEVATQFVKSFSSSWESLKNLTPIQKIDQLNDYHLKALDQEKKKLEYEKLNYLITNKKNSLGEIDTKMSFLESQLMAVTAGYNIPIAQLIENSESKLKLIKNQNHLKSLLTLKCQPHDLSYYQSRLKDFKSSDQIKEALEQTIEKIHHIQLQVEELQKDLAKAEFQEQKLKDLSCKIELDHKLQQEIFDFETNMDHYLVVKSAEFLMDHMIWQYQQTYQQDLLLIASGYLKELTNDAYCQIRLNLTSNKESYLSCLSINNVFFTVDQLSEGTRDQLYLSLKLALIELFLKQNEDFPLLLDDILVNFDDVRAVKALKVIEKLSTKMQVIFLTHHPHLVRLIEQNCNPDKFEILSLDKVKALTS